MCDRSLVSRWLSKQKILSFYFIKLALFCVKIINNFKQKSFFVVKIILDNFISFLFEKI